ncbi:oligopeptide/dipeptide ABC transporter ATP-binding protein [Herbaspirillum lusitanum]|uniref:oligopeptide/dipeptide ABC transporter ATP-binding protein n=1 Tax=Herbaspirillum lusitanum TaxID=213312 RepID=UPI0002D31F91
MLRLIEPTAGSVNFMGEEISKLSSSALRAMRRNMQMVFQDRQAQILDLMRALKREHGTAILMITHDLGVVAEMCDRVVVMYAGQVVEQSSVRDLFDAPAHPYTQALMRARPALDAVPGEPLEAIPGAVPLPGSVESGCRFAARCPKVQERCRRDAPTLDAVDDRAGDGHLARCWYPN